MSMEIQGRKPTAICGKKLQLEFWAWRPVHDLIGTLCTDLLGDKLIRDMKFGQGAGPVDPQICETMAERFEQWFEQHPEGFVLESGIRMTPEGRFVTELELTQNPSMETISPYAAGKQPLERWIKFLRNCGGFEVW